MSVVARVLGVLLVLAAPLPAAAVYCACGGATATDWTPQDQTDSLDLYRSTLAVKAACLGDAGCDPAVVRAKETAELCTLGAQLHRHGNDVADGGGTCRAKGAP